MAELTNYTPPPNMDAKALIQRAASQLRAWHEVYGKHNPAWLPPAGDVRWLEDAEAYLTTHRWQQRAGESKEGLAACPTSRGNLLELEPNERATETSNRRTGKEEQGGGEAGRCDAIRTGGAERGARGSNAAQHEIAVEPGRAAPASTTCVPPCLEDADHPEDLLREAQRYVDPDSPLGARIRQRLRHSLPS